MAKQFTDLSCSPRSKSVSCISFAIKVSLKIFFFQGSFKARSAHGELWLHESRAFQLISIFTSATAPLVGRERGKRNFARSFRLYRVNRTACPWRVSLNLRSLYLNVHVGTPKYLNTRTTLMRLLHERLGYRTTEGKKYIGSLDKAHGFLSMEETRGTRRAPTSG